MKWLREWVHKAIGRFVIFLLLLLFPIIYFAVFLALEAINQNKIVLTSEKNISVTALEQNKPISIPSRMTTLFVFSIVIFIIFFVLFLLVLEKQFYRTLSICLYRLVDPLITGAPLGMFVSVIYFFILTKTQASDFALHFGSATGLYIAFVGLFIALYGIYSEKVLFYDINEFMDYMIVDMVKIRKRIFWCYPGLSFGSISARGDRYNKFRKNLLSNVFMNKEIEKEILAFNENEIVLLYNAYIDTANKIQDNTKKEKEMEQIKGAIYDSILFINICRWGQGETLDSESERTITETLSPYKEKPEEKKDQIADYRVKFSYTQTESYLRFHVIILDDNVYILTPFGLPQRFNHIYKFTHNPDYEHPVDFHVTRIVDKRSAEVLIDQIRKEIQQFQHIKVQEQNQSKTGGTK